MATSLRRKFSVQFKANGVTPALLQTNLGDTVLSEQALPHHRHTPATSSSS